MHNVKFLTSFVFLITSYSCLVIAQPESVKFTHLGSDNGLSQNFISCIIQDHKGFMWFGTKDGLNRYDGHNFVIHQHDPFDSTSLSDNYITSLFEDSRGYIWVGTLNGGLNIFDRKTETFYQIVYESKVSDNNIPEEVKSISEDKDGNIWIATRGRGIFRLSLKTDNSFDFSSKNFSNQTDNPKTLSSNIITTIFIDSKGILWIGTLKGLDRFNKEDESFTHFKINTKNIKAPSSYFDKNVFSITETKDKNLWLGTLSGLVQFNREDGSFKLFPHHYNIFRYGWGSILQIVEDYSGKLWLATPAELMRFNPFSKTYDYFKNDLMDNNSLSYNSISSLFIDRTEVLWVGTAGMGINVYDPKSSRFSTLFVKNNPTSRITGFSVRTIMQEDEDVYWISTDVLYRWNRKTGQVKSYETSSNRPDDFGNIGPWSIIKSFDGKIWAATTEGLYMYDSSTEIARQYKFNLSDSTGLPQKEVFTVFEDMNKNIWAITENYLCKLTDIDKGIFNSYRYSQVLPYNRRVRPIIYQDKSGMFWIGTRNGLLLFNEEEKTFLTFKNDPLRSNSLSNDNINAICPDPITPEKILWIGTAGGGLNKLNVEEKTFKHFTEKDGLPNNVVYGILPDKQGNLWLSTNKGLSKFNPQKNSFRNFDVNDGLQSNEFNTGAYFLSESGEMFFGGIKGLNYFHPDKVNDNLYKPQIALTNIKINDHYLSVKNDKTIFQKSISELDKIELSHDKDVITFEFTSLDYSSPSKNKFAYKLENINEDWIYAGSNRQVTFTNLPPGKYVFRVKGSNNDGIWNEDGVSLEVIIKPPWWNTWWAYFIYGSIIVLGLYLLRRYELNRINLKNQLRIEKITTDSLRNLDHIKSQFFANISHEFRTPLTLILGQIESVMSTKIDTKLNSKLQVANRNARRLLTLINQLLELSKIESGSMKLSSEQYNIVSFLKSLFYSFESLAETRKIKMKFESENENIPVVFDPDKMEKIFFNLISNAFKFTPSQGEIRVTIIKKDGLVEIKIKDTGKGIPEENLKFIFDRFYQVDRSNTREREGTGIGLALSKELIEMHKGKIIVSSIPGAGTEFTVTFPIGKQENEYSTKELTDALDNEFLFNDSIDSESTNTEFSNPNNHLDHREIILIIEDNADVRSYIREQFEEEYGILEALNGEEGISIARREIPDLIITDVMMPKMDGFQFCKAIRCDEKTSHIPIIMLTAKAGLDDKIQGLETGVDDFVTKPFSAKELKVRVKNLIYQRKELRKRFSASTIIKPSEVTVQSIDQIFLDKVFNTIEKHFENEQFSIENLADEMNMSVSQLNRKLNALIDQPPGQLIRSFRLQRAADLLRQNAGSVAEICYRVGFNDQAYFSRAFKKQFGCSPTDYKRIPK